MSRPSFPEGTERIYGGKLFVKYDGRWQAKSRICYQKSHGPIPLGYVITFLDGDKTNCADDNLKCVSRSQLVAVNRNFSRCRDPEITKAQFLFCDLLEAKKVG